MHSTNNDGSRDRPGNAMPGSVDSQDSEEASKSATGRQIIASLPTELRDRLESSILGRSDLAVRFIVDPLTAVDLAHRRTPALLLLYDAGLGVLDRVLPSLRRAVTVSPFPVIVLAEFAQEKTSDWVSATLPVDVDAGELSRTIGRLLELPSRAGRRHLIRVGVELDNPASFSATGNTVDMSATGMLIECNKRLRIGDVVSVSVLGVGQAPELPVRIVREAEARHPNLHRYGTSFEDVDPEVVEKLIEQLVG